MKNHRDRPSDDARAAKASPPLRGRPDKVAGGVEHLGRAPWPALRRSPAQPPSPADHGHLQPLVDVLLLHLSLRIAAAARPRLARNSPGL